MAAPPPILTVQCVREPDRLATRLLLHAYALLLPPTGRPLNAIPDPVGAPVPPTASRVVTR